MKSLVLTFAVMGMLEAIAAERSPVPAFGKLPPIRQIALSPDGTRAVACATTRAPITPL
ncbi:MAG: hypothetical protein QF921_16630 [Pseudomonadales bacterium]|jgi:hypothetical protein|nr:hypothetical protein [Pseudomonadales bacterium]MDP6472735.1 hypothetical protein [Pseudomonadales bacterium]MDP6827948.1 hypothetical protein [Pseudomonadales bacterium]MDP6973111.1 hypothetical protein [Pseudomonadales bacterium]